MIAALLLIAVSAYATIQTYRLATLPGRRAVRSAAHHSRTALMVGVLLVPAVLATIQVEEAFLAAPLLIAPAVAVFSRSLPRVSVLMRRLYADPWGPSDPPIRRLAADPALVVPAQAMLLGALGMIIASGGWGAALATYAVVGGATTVAWRKARQRKAALVRGGAGVLQRTLVQTA